MGLGTVAYFAFGGLFTATLTNALRQLPLLRGARNRLRARAAPPRAGPGNWKYTKMILSH